MTEEKLIYANEKQDAFFEAEKKIKVFIGGRGSGKSTVLGDEIYECVLTMPRSRGFVASATDETIMNFSLPSILERLESLGEIEGEDFVVSTRPPKWFEKPYNPPKKFQHVISFSNGTCIDILSMYGKNAGRGGNYQWGFFDEAALIDKETHDKAVMGAMRGNLYRVTRIDLEQFQEMPYGKVIQEKGRWIWEIPWRQNPRYRMRAYVSTMPWTSEGEWLLNFEDNPDAFFIESTALDNVAVLGHEYIDDMRATLPPLVFAIEVMNERMGKLPDGFYSAFEESHLTIKRHYNTNHPLEVSYDFNAGFNSMIVAQAFKSLAYVHDEIYVKGNLIVEDLTAEFIRKYENHKCKQIDIYGDRNGNNRFADSRKTIYERIEVQLRAAGWKIFRPHKGLDSPHKDKHEMINLAFRETDRHLPPIRINKINCKGLIISMQRAPITPDFKKDKKSERKPSIYREHATDLSDCLDNWYVFRFKSYMKGGAGSYAGGFAVG